ncbi:hypothetical protein PGTUg99_037314 [Puccinia graminis f. sp. tritici]|uniref:Uncharacterized protein n=1 Tax=Puccinia graminis f. sp. tritici TaxID=56615 RepID=A0A5B0RJG9_PUCGR|nr:hypothetical protein PGTUg99_026188 [Puccinia graminis f. sp. tritici]KAA1136715.1 hypothetical protein PGTUg99_037314 [Puccinia graminis f. sp. tritici]
MMGDMAHHGESPSTFCRMLGPPSRGDFCSPAELGQQLALTKSPDSSPAKRFVLPYVSPI